MYAQMEISNCPGKFPVVAEIGRVVWESWARGHVLGALFSGISKRERILFSIYPKIKYMGYLLYFIFLGHVLGIFTILISYYLLHFFGRNSVVELKQHLFSCQTDMNSGANIKSWSWSNYWTDIAMIFFFNLCIGGNST